MILLRQAGLYKLFERAGEEGWKAFVPVYYTIIWLRLIGKPAWWIIFFFIPGINILMSFVISVDLAKVFNRFSLADHAAALIVPFFYFPYLGFFSNERYVGPEGAKNFKRSKTREWIDAIAFAVIAATVIRSFFIEAYTIPTPSMEETLLVDDYLFVSKLNYGPRVPMTPLSFPLAHNVMPIFGGKSYLEWPSIPYYRLPGWETVERNDIVVFNWPADVGRPVDKKDNYIKRCVAVSGDSLKIIDREIYLNGVKQPFPEFSQFAYKIITDGSFFQKSYLNNLGIKFNPENEFHGENNNDIRSYGNDQKTNLPVFVAFLTTRQYNELKKQTNIKVIEPIIQERNNFESDVFHQYANLPWNIDNFGPMYVPKKGATIPMTVANYYIYQKAIREYENNPTLEMHDTAVFMNGQPLKEYTFKMNYYFMMGDNRHNSSDGRMWGFVPEDHIVGKPIFNMVIDRS